MDKKIIEPTTGRRVLLFVASAGNGCLDMRRPFDGGIAFVHEDGTHINVGYRDHQGEAHSVTNVPLLDRAQDEADAHSLGTDYAVWMPFQFAQALRAAEKPPEPAQAPSPVMLMGGSQQMERGQQATGYVITGSTGLAGVEPGVVVSTGQQDPVSGTGGTIEGASTGPASTGTIEDQKA